MSVGRRLHRSALAALLLGAATLAAPADAQVVRGSISDVATDRALEGVLLTLVGPDGAPVQTTRTDSAGLYRFAVGREGSFRVRAEHVGYRPATSAPLRLDAGRVLTLDMRLPPQIVYLDTVQGRAQPSRRRAVLLSDFYRRADQGAFGTFITYAEIDRWRPLRVSDMLASRVPGVQLSPNPGRGGNNLIVRGTCSPTIYIDGVRVALMGQNIDELVRPGELEGVEVYRSVAEAPALYQGMNAGCSAILFWTRIGRGP
jgi:hypothetical protein